MRKLLLKRTENTTDGVFGELYGVSPSPLYTAEEDWKGNQRRVSSIPAGVYVIRRTIFRKYGYPTFEITDVPGRTRILAHPANTEEDVEGCIGLGLERGYLNVPDEDTPGRPMTRKRAVLQSKKAFDRFMEYMDGVDEATLTVEWAEGVAH